MTGGARREMPMKIQTLKTRTVTQSVPAFTSPRIICAEAARVMDGSSLHRGEAVRFFPETPTYLF